MAMRGDRRLETPLPAPRGWLLAFMSLLCEVYTKFSVSEKTCHSVEVVMKRLVKYILCAAMALGFAGSAAAQQLVVAHDTSFKPFEFKGPDGQYMGFDIDLWKEIATRLKLDYKMQPMDFNGIIPGLQSGNIDVGIAGMTIKPERAAVVDFSKPYYDSGLMILVRENESAVKRLEDLAGKVVAVKTGSSSVDFMKEFGKAKELKLFPNNEGMFFELLSSGADAVLFDMPVVKEFAATAGKGKVKVVGELYQGQSYGIAFPKGSPLPPKVNEALDAIHKDGVYDNLYRKWFGYAPIRK